MWTEWHVEWLSCRIAQREGWHCGYLNQNKFRASSLCRFYRSFSRNWNNHCRREEDGNYFTQSFSRWVKSLVTFYLSRQLAKEKHWTHWICEEKRGVERSYYDSRCRTSASSSISELHWWGHSLYIFTVLFICLYTHKCCIFLSRRLALNPQWQGRLNSTQLNCLLREKEWKKRRGQNGIAKRKGRMRLSCTKFFDSPLVFKSLTSTATKASCNEMKL